VRDGQDSIDPDAAVSATIYNPRPDEACVATGGGLAEKSEGERAEAGLRVGAARRPDVADTIHGGPALSSL
jgi:hypothetical protein